MLRPRFAAGRACSIALLTAASVASAVLLEVNDASQIIEHESTPLAPGVKERPRRRRARQAADDPRHRLRPALRRGHDRKGKPQTARALGHDDPRPPGPVEGRHGDHVAAARPARSTSPGTGTRQDQRGLRRSAGRSSRSRRSRRCSGIPIHHSSASTSAASAARSTALGCVYIDVDRRYFNDNNPPAGGAAVRRRSTSSAGYQKLCGQDALDYVRFRHLDTDLVRAARQQDFLRRGQGARSASAAVRRPQAAAADLRRVHADRHPLDAPARSCGCSSSSPSPPSKPAAAGPVPAHGRRRTARDVAGPTGACARRSRRFLDVAGSADGRGHDAPHGRARRDAQRASSRTVHRDRPAPACRRHERPGEDHRARQLSLKLRRLPVYYPKLVRELGGSYVRRRDSRAYTIRDRTGKPHRAYRIVAYEGRDRPVLRRPGHDLEAPPILDDPSETRTHARAASYELYYDGSRLRLVAWRTERGVVLGLEHPAAHAHEQADARASRGR